MGAGRPVRSAIWTDDDPVAREIESAGDLVGGVCRRHHDSVRAVRVSARQLGIVAPDLACDPGGVTEKVEVVDGDQARGTPGRDEQGGR